MLKMNVRRNGMLAMMLSGGLIFATGCGGNDAGESEVGPDTPSNSSASVSVESIMLTEAPEGAQPIVELKQTAQEGDEVVVHVVVGGNISPLVEGRAVASVVDASVANACVSEDDHCTTPWDYCCTPREEITANSATIQIVDADGRAIEADLSESFSGLSTLTVVGVVGPRPNDQVFTINATGIYVAPQTQ